ncbi:MAG: hypothetical protein ACQKBV_13245 [Puniceicoccales bacterium]
MSGIFEQHFDPLAGTHGKSGDLRRFLVTFGLFGFFQAVILITCVVIFFSYPRGNDPSAWGVEKRMRLTITPGPRLVLMGDSSLVLGLNSTALEEAFPAYNPVNAGLYAFLGQRVMLNEVEDLVRPGDVVVISWAYAHFARNEIANLYYHYAVQRPESILHFRSEEIAWFLDSCSYMIKEAMKRSKKVLMGSERAAFGPPYGRDSLNRYGDGVGHYGMESPPGMTPDIKPLTITPNGYTGGIIDYLNDVNAKLEARGAKVLFAYPPITETSYEDNREALDLLDQTLRTRLDFPVINRPDEMFFPRDQFYDTAYHLKEPSVYDRSDRLVESLRPYLTDQPEKSGEAQP